MRLSKTSRADPVKDPIFRTTSRNYWIYWFTGHSCLVTDKPNPIVVAIDVVESVKPPARLADKQITIEASFDYLI
jgi:hypothetical protein